MIPSLSADLAMKSTTSLQRKCDGVHKQERDWKTHGRSKLPKIVLPLAEAKALSKAFKKLKPKYVNFFHDLFALPDPATLLFL